MGALKLTACMKVVSKMGEMDQESLLERLDRYTSDGVPKDRAQVMAASDTLAELIDERREFMAMLREQHPDLFRVTNAIPEDQDVDPDAPDADDSSIRRGASRSEEEIAAARADGWMIIDNDLPSREAAERIVKLRTKGSSVVRPMAAWQNAEVRVIESDNPGLWSIEVRRPDIKRSAARDVTETPEFKRWFGDSKVVDADGKPLVVYHGTDQDFDEFAPRSGVPLKMRLQRWVAELLGSDSPAQKRFPMSDTKSWFAERAAGGPLLDLYEAQVGTIWFTSATDLASDYANERRGGRAIAGTQRDESHPNIMPVYLSLRRPVVLDFSGSDRTKRTITHADGRIETTDALFYNGDFSLALRVAASLARKEGADGFIIKAGNFPAKNEGFRSRRDDIYVAFRPEQIKSAIGNNGQFDPESADITRSPARQTEMPEFKKWFGDSVMTEDGQPGGEPMTLYHGGFNFADAPSGKAVPKVSGRGALGAGFYMTPSEELASDYAYENDGVVNQVYARIKRPLEIRNTGSQDPAVVALEMLGVPRAKAMSMTEKAYEKYGYIGNEIKSRALDAGYDGLARYSGDELVEVVVWTSTQVKSATNNDGQFSWNPDIRRSPARAQEDTPEFKAWSDGLPVHASFEDRSSDRGIYKLFHMTTADFDEFKPGGLNPSDSGPAIWLSTDPSATSAAFRVGNEERGFRAGARTMPVYAKVKSPLVIDDKSMLDYAREAFADGSREFPQLISKSTVDALKSDGYDSIIFDGPGVGWSGASAEVIVLDGKQIKSAIGNSGAFDPADADITRSPARQVETPEFKAWFDGSKVVDKKGRPLVMYHGSDADITSFKPATYFSEDADEAADYAGKGAIYPVYVSIKKPYEASDEQDFENRSELTEISEEYAEALAEDGYDGVIARRNGVTLWAIPFGAEQVKSATGNRGTFDPTSGDITRSTGRTATGADWDSPSAEKFDDLVYKLQDKNIDTKRVVEAIKTASGSIADDLNVYLQEELYHGRAAKRTEDFVNMELNPLIEQMARDGLKLEDVEEFMHARHAPEANAVIAQRNPGVAELQDGGSGMKTADALQYMATLPADLKQKLEAATAKVDAIIAKTRELYVDYELESRDTVDAWGRVFQHYIPLQREDKNGSPGLGQGFSVKGKETKGRTGSTRKVVDIMANIAMQREKAIVRGEKNRVSQALVGLATANPNEDFWQVDEVPTERVFNEKTGLVEDRVDPLYKSRENAVIAKIADASGKVKEHAVLFNEEDPRALRMAQALKNLDANQIEGLLGVSAKITRYFAAVNTQYNPVFGAVNLVRDVQGALLNLSSTPLAGDQAKIGRYTLSALRGIYADARAARKGQSPSSQWASLWDEFQEIGGQTGYRDLFRTSEDRANAIKDTLNPDAWADSRLGKIFTANGALKVPLAQAKRGAGWIFQWLSDYNLAMENGVRLAAYKAGLEKGMSKEQAASAAKNLTVNFNRKGQVSQQAGAMYAFFNASLQGTARLGQTLFDMEPGKPKTIRLNSTGKKIVYGGIMLGSIQAMALAAAGFNDDDPPEFARERGLIIPVGGKKYVTIPMPLGFHVIPSIGRIATEFALSGFKDPHERALSLASLFADTFNPIGNAGLSMQTLAPTALDPLVALTENKDWTGKPIARESSNRAIPGHSLGRDTASSIAKFLSEGINTLSGGNKYVAGVFSPTPDQIDYLLGQVTGGVGRELSKVEQTVLATARGEDLPTYKVPLVGRFVGDAKSQASEGAAFYANSDRLNKLETEIKGLEKDGKRAEAAELRRNSSETYLITVANQAERQIQRLRSEKRELMKAGAPREQVKAVEERITEVMSRLNRAVESLREKQEG